jgi:hypothetical protein
VLLPSCVKVSKRRFFSYQQSQRRSLSLRPSGAQPTWAEIQHIGRPDAGGQSCMRSNNRSIQERCHANLHLAWSGSRQRRSRACWLSQKTVRKPLPSSSRA